MSTLSLFDPLEPEIRKKLRDGLARLAESKLFLGSSSWKYQGWLDQIYTRERYLARGRFSPRRFEAECLAEYAEIFRIVCGDFSFYQFPTPAFWAKLFGNVPKTLQFALKAPEMITVRQFPAHPRYGPRAGAPNPTFLSFDLFEQEFLASLEPYRTQIAVLIFEFGSFSRQVYATPERFVEDLGNFLSRLPLNFRYAVEVRNPEFLCAPYFDLLRGLKIAHVLNAWTRMPPLLAQIEYPGIFTANFTVVRALLKAGRRYEEAVKLFEPYRAVQEPNNDTREALRQILSRAEKRAELACLFLNNRLEGNAPGTIADLLEIYLHDR